MIANCRFVVTVVDCICMRYIELAHSSDSGYFYAMISLVHQIGKAVSLDKLKCPYVSRYVSILGLIIIDSLDGRIPFISL